ncbi:hypothetical protein EIP86_005985 [Pleurotus ostreatoroseus]|nr:hypothetical protein EIP86_005985 [Pleurotus ostreatoroseus]
MGFPTALDEIISQIMESSHGHPVAASEEIMSKLPREVLEEGSPLLEKDCAICKDQFSLKTEDPDEQPDHHSPNPGSPSGSSRDNGNNNNRERSPSGSAGNNPRGGGGGLFDGLFTILSNAAGPSNPNANANNRTSSTNPDTGANSTNNTTNNSNNRPRSPPSRRGSGRDNIPGAWYDVD